MDNITAHDRRAKTLRIVAKGFEAALKETAGDDIQVVPGDDGTGAFEVMLIDDAHTRTRTFWFAVADDPGEGVVEYAPAWYDLELGQRTSISEWTDMPGLFEAFARWLREEATP
jgi:hypothetical protein